MVFQIHHSKGTLTVSAPSRESAIKWATRQLGYLSRKFSVTELHVKDGIEKTGTGIHVMDVTSNLLVNELADALVGHSYGREDNAIQEYAQISPRLVAQATTWH